MKNLVVYDSQYGNTEKIALAIAGSLTQSKAVRVNEFTQDDLKDLEVLVVGSPTQGGRPTPAIQQFINQLPPLHHVKVAAFDTGFKADKLNFALRLLVKIIGYASPKIAKNLKAKGAGLLLPPHTFIVTDTRGPLEEGQLDLASNWLNSHS